MQFLASTWARYGVSADGGGAPDRWNAADAIYGAANYLRASGAPGDYRKAIYAYNHASWYVAEVESWAAKYRGPPAQLVRHRRKAGMERASRARTRAWRAKPRRRCGSSPANSAAARRATVTSR